MLVVVTQISHCCAVDMVLLQWPAHIIIFKGLTF